MRIRQGFVCSNFLRDAVDPGDLFAAAAGIGYEAVDLWTRDERTLALARENGLVVALMTGHASIREGLNHPDHHGRIDGELRASIDLAARHEVRSLVCFSGNRNAGQSDYQGLVQCARALKRVAGYAQDKGVVLTVELLNSRVDHPGYQADHTDWGVALCEMVASPNVKLLYDVYHMQIMEGDAIRRIRDHIGWIGHVHTAGNPGRRDLDDDQEINYAGVCRALAAAGYDGFVSHEFSPRGDPVEALRRAHAVCDQG